MSPTNEGFGHAQRAEAIASRLVGLKGVECLVFSDRVRVEYLSKLNLKYNSGLHGINYVYRRNGDLNTLPTFFRLILDLPYFPLDFLKAVTLSRGYDVFVNDYNPHLTVVPGMRTINISHYLPYKYKWSDLRMNFYSTLVERPIVYGERLRCLLRLSESFVMDIRPELMGAPPRPSLNVQEYREPLVDVVETDDEIKVVAELPGVEKDQIQLYATERGLTISVDTPERKYYKELELPAEVDPSTAKSKYRNGILEVVLKKAPKKPKGVRLKVE